jgi:hypothetical protein
MAPARDMYTTETLRTHSSPNSVVNAEEGLAVANETSPLLQHRHTGGLGRRQIVSEQRFPARSSISTFIDNNSGMFFIVASQFFYTAMNVTVQFLNRLDEPVPTLEVCHILIVTIPPGSLPIYFIHADNMPPDGEYLIPSQCRC